MTRPQVFAPRATAVWLTKSTIAVLAVLTVAATIEFIDGTADDQQRIAGDELRQRVDR